jgi:hypothetical protein
MNGCNRQQNCPCNIWIQCIQYKDIRTRKWKRNHDRQIAVINKWYLDNFRIRYEYPDFFSNG